MIYSIKVKMSDYKTDLEIAREADKKPIIDLAKEKLSISDQDLIPYGHYKAKISSNFLNKVETALLNKQKETLAPDEALVYIMRHDKSKLAKVFCSLELVICIHNLSFE